VLLPLAVAGVVGAAAWAVRGRSSAVFGPSVWRGDPAVKAIALTFDDGPSESTPALLDLLDRHGAKATFFQVGRNVERLPDVAREVSRRGHETGNHTWSHRMLVRGGAEEEVSRAQDLLARVHGVPPRLFRAPYGVRWFGLQSTLARHGLASVMWTTIGRDWTLTGGEVARRLERGIGPGAILCLHDGRELTPRPDIRATVQAVEAILPGLASIGYNFETVSNLRYAR